MIDYKQKVFRVTLLMTPPGGSATEEWTRYFVAASVETVRAVMYERHGDPKYCFRGGYPQYEVEEVPVEVL